MSNMSAWRAFEIGFASASFVFSVGAVVGLMALWIGVAMLPQATGIITVSHSLVLVTLLSLTVLGSFSCIITARMIAIHALEALLGSLNDKAEVKGLREWFDGQGLVTAWVTLTCPFFVTVLVVAGSWMLSLIISLVLAGAFRGYLSSKGALQMYLDMKGTLGHMPHVRPPRRTRIWPLALSAALVVTSTSLMVPSLKDALRHSIEPVTSGLSILTQSINDKMQTIERMTANYRARLDIDVASFHRERIKLLQGEGSLIETENARYRVLSTDLEYTRYLEGAREELTRLRRERLELETRLRALRSAAPALQR